MAFSFERGAELFPHLAQDLPNALQGQPHLLRNVGVTQPVAAIRQAEYISRVRSERRQDPLGAFDPLACKKARLRIRRGIDEVRREATGVSIERERLTARAFTAGGLERGTPPERPRDPEAAGGSDVQPFAAR